MENVIYIQIILVVRLLFWLQRSVFGTDLQIGSLELCRINKPLLYKDVSCPTGTRMISYNDVWSHSKQFLHEFTTSVWINTTDSFTPWMIYQGIYKIDQGYIVNRTSVHNRTQFIHCIQFCSIYNHQYIGLQEDLCYCLSSHALDTNNLISTRIGKICREGHIIYCTTRNDDYKMAVYKKDDNTHEGFGECLTLKIKSDTDWSFVPSPCNDTNTSILCQNVTSGNYQTSNENRKDARLRYCGQANTTYVDFKTFNTTKKAYIPAAGDYWLNNIRESICLESGKCSNEHCVSGNEVDGQIVLKITDCSDKRHALCFVMKRILEFNSSSSKLSTTKYADCDEADTRSFNSSAPLTVIVAAVSAFILIVLIIIVIFKRICKQRTYSSPHGPVYATVRKDVIHEANVIKNGDRLEVAKEEKDNTYDHTDFTTRKPLQQTDASNYDRMENIQVTGESIYHHTVTFKTSTGTLQGDESVYHHATNFKIPTENEQN